MTNNPFDVPAWCSKTAWDVIEATEEFQLGLQLVSDVQALHSFCAERPRWASLWDQLQRAAQSVVLNYAQSFRGRGYYQSDLLIALGECYEVCACISIFPEASSLKPVAVRLAKLISTRIQEAPQKP